MRWVLSSVALLLVTVVTATSEARLPERLSETGLYVSGQVGVVARENQAFSPQYPLWTDGAEKSRWVYLPPGTQIDATDPNAWDLPVGTRFWKEFRFADRKVETRMIWRTSQTDWVFATYVWNAEQTEAFLAPEKGVMGAAELGSGKRHNVPSRTDCTACHGTTRPGPLGFNALQLSDDRDPNALHGEPLAPGMTTLKTLVAGNAIRGAFSEWVTRPPRIATDNPRTRAVLGYLVANCGSCHNGRGEIAALAPVVRQEDLLRDGDAVAASLVDQRTKWQAPGKVEGTVLVDTHAPDQSALLTRLRSRSPSSQMPPLGTVMRDTDAVQTITEWVSRDLARQSHR
jgi:hypothetical protein